MALSSPTAAYLTAQFRAGTIKTIVDIQQSPAVRQQVASLLEIDPVADGFTRQLLACAFTADSDISACMQQKCPDGKCQTRKHMTNAARVFLEQVPSTVRDYVTSLFASASSQRGPKPRAARQGPNDDEEHMEVEVERRSPNDYQEGKQVVTLSQRDTTYPSLDHRHVQVTWDITTDTLHKTVLVRPGLLIPDAILAALGLRLGRIVGEGSFGSVIFACVWNDCSYAIKFGDVEEREFLMAREMGDLSYAPKVYQRATVTAIETLDSPASLGGMAHAIVYDYHTALTQNRARLTTTDLLIMDFVDANLLQFVKRRRHSELTELTPQDGAKLAIMLAGMSNLGFMHNDLHMANILVKLETPERVDKFYFTDFGFSFYPRVTPYETYNERNNMGFMRLWPQRPFGVLARMWDRLSILYDLTRRNTPELLQHPRFAGFIDVIKRSLLMQFPWLHERAADNVGGYLMTLPPDELRRTTNPQEVGNALRMFGLSKWDILQQTVDYSAAITEAEEQARQLQMRQLPSN